MRRGLLIWSGTSLAYLSWQYVLAYFFGWKHHSPYFIDQAFMASLFGCFVTLLFLANTKK